MFQEITFFVTTESRTEPNSVKDSDKDSILIDHWDAIKTLIKD